jgi:hypothetical protein
MTRDGAADALAMGALYHDTVMVQKRATRCSKIEQSELHAITPKLLTTSLPMMKLPTSTGSMRARRFCRLQPNERLTDNA